MLRMRDDAITTDTTGDPAAPLDRNRPGEGATAGEALRQADELTSRTRRAGRWYARYMFVVSGGFGLMTLLLGLGPDGEAGRWWALVLLAAWAVFVAVLLAWAVRRPVQGAIGGRRYIPGWVGTGALYAAALFGGRDQNLPVWAWVLAALVVPLPLVVAAVRVHRSLA